MNISDNLKIGDKLYYPSTKGIALVCEVIEMSEEDVVVVIGDSTYYLPKNSVDAHGILIDRPRSKAYITQRLDDPENSIIYLRYLWREGWIDRAYNAYCQQLKRIEEPVVIEPTSKATPMSTTPSPLK